MFIQENEHQLEECNSTGSTKVELRGYCYGQEHPTLLYVNIEQSSAKLPSDFTFVEGATSYLTSEFDIAILLFSTLLIERP